MNCRICDSAEVARIVVAREMRFGSRDEFVYFECARCGCVQLQDIPDLLKYYPQNYYSFQQFGFVKRLFKDRWATYSFHGSNLIGWLMAFGLGKNASIESVRRAGVAFDTPILDVGCGSGELLVLLHSLGFSNLTGIDPFLSRDIHHRNGLRVFKLDLMETAGQFGLIMFHHSFEHTTDPIATIDRAQQLLVNGGQIVVRVPVSGTMAWKQYGPNWVQLDPPRHIFLPTVRSMKILASRIGLELRDVVFDSTDFQFWGSEQYLRNIPLHDPKSLWPFWKRVLVLSKIRRQRRYADALNARLDGDSACFYFHKPR
jgi:SAM-dependent methyltransferase